MECDAGTARTATSTAVATDRGLASKSANFCACLPPQRGPTIDALVSWAGQRERQTVSPTLIPSVSSAEFHLYSNAFTGNNTTSNYSVKQDTFYTLLVHG